MRRVMRRAQRRLGLPLWALALSLFACSAPSGPRVYGAPVGVEELERAAKPLSALSASDSGTEVTAQGTISRVCQTMGCWFYLAEGQALVYVDLEQGSRFTIPSDATGHRAVVRGVYRAQDGDVRLIAKSAAVWP